MATKKTQRPKLRFQPTGSGVLLSPIDTPDSAVAKPDPDGPEIIIPEAHRRPTQVGRVESVGPRAAILAPGDMVLVPPHVGTTVNYAGVAYRLVKEEDIQARISA